MAKRSMKKMRQLKKGVVRVYYEGIDDDRANTMEIFAEWQHGAKRKRKNLTNMGDKQVLKFFAQFTRVKLDPSARDENVGLGRGSYTAKKYAEILAGLY